MKGPSEDGPTSKRVLNLKVRRSQDINMYITVDHDQFIQTSSADDLAETLSFIHINNGHKMQLTIWRSSVNNQVYHCAEVLARNLYLSDITLLIL